MKIIFLITLMCVFAENVVELLLKLELKLEPPIAFFY